MKRFLTQKVSEFEVKLKIQTNLGLGTSLALVAIVLATTGCGENPSFVESGPANQAVDPNATNSSSSIDKSECQADSINGGSSTNGVDGSGNGSGNGAGGGGGPGGIELPLNLIAGSDTSTIQNHSKVDILWVVDSSGSMSEEQAYLGQNFNSFMGQLVASGTDFQTGVTTTDICSLTSPAQIPSAERYCPTLDGSPSTHLRGSLTGQAGRKVLKPGMADIASRFIQYTNVGTQGSGFEHGLKAAEMAVQKSLAGSNENLVRPDAFLAVIVVSDEEDDGIGLGMPDTYSNYNYVAAGATSVHYTDDHLISNLNIAKGVGKFSVSAITGTRNSNGSMCSAPHSIPREEGTQYISAARKTGGIVQSICDTNWSSSLSSIGQDIAGQSAQIILSHVAYQGTIKVFVANAENTQWTYNPGNNAIKFNSGYVPAQGSSVRVDYLYAP
ncbi:MAG: hypothetical protein NTV34_16380 [Proteobacteria bacterium]|nr:hypothetical protein [Pseudomonadota bacterium]